MLNKSVGGVRSQDSGVSIQELGDRSQEIIFIYFSRPPTPYTLHPTPYTLHPTPRKNFLPHTVVRNSPPEANHGNRCSQRD
ncbi:MAG: hypothetical protein GPJ13_20215 [Microcystis aeruginosa W11-06]|nr:hypothetical protein [Microcystis aeruginosa W11-03]NCR95934.1 hypothetical protein [Microcystis aeruginosa W11-06]